MRRSYPAWQYIARAGYLRVPWGVGRWCQRISLCRRLDWDTGTNLVGRRHLEGGPVGQRMSGAGSSHLRAGPSGPSGWPPWASGKLPR